MWLWLWLEESDTRVEAVSNTSIVTLRVVGGDEKGSLKFETVKYGHESQGTRTRERLCWRGPAAYTKDRPIISSDWAPHKNKTVNFKINQYLVMSPRWDSTPRLTDWLTVSRNLTLILTLRSQTERNGAYSVERTTCSWSGGLSDLFTTKPVL
jgi:hypothetical protein